MVEYAIGLICGGAGAWLIAAHAWRERARQHSDACRAWADAHDKVEKERDGLRKAAADSAEALARANSRTEVAEEERDEVIAENGRLRCDRGKFLMACEPLREYLRDNTQPCVPSR